MCVCVCVSQFDKLSNDLSNLEITDGEELTGIVNIIFDKVSLSLSLSLARALSLESVFPRDRMCSPCDDNRS